MSFEPPGRGPARPGGRVVIAEPERRRGRVLAMTLVVILVLVVGFIMFTNFWTDLLWYRSVDATSVFTTTLLTRALLFLGFGAFMAIVVGFNAWLPYRLRPMFQAMNAEQASLERYRAALEPLRRVLLIAAPLVLGVLAGASASSEWKTWLLWRNSTPFGVTDPQFGMDVSFFTFTLPALRFILGFLFATVVLSFLVALVVHYVYGGIRLQSPDGRASTAAQAHLSILVGIFALLKAVAYVLDRYDLAVSQDGLVPGLTYTDIHAILPAKNILAIISIICAVLFFVGAFRGGWRLAVTSFVLLLASSALIGGLYPTFVQSVEVKPTEVVKESPYIARSIDATRTAYGVNNAVVTNYPAVDVPNPADLKASLGTTQNVRLMDPTVVSPTFAALEQNRTYYSFANPLDIDRYTLSGKLQGTVIAAREINLAGIPNDQRNWATDHIIYTHGFGVVAAYDNTATPDGKPSFFENGLPPTGKLTINQPRIYYGENSPNYSIAGAPVGSSPQELDYPTENQSQDLAKFTYTGTGGIPVGSFLNRLLFTVKYQEPNILLSDLVNNDSRILEVRDPRDRVQKVAPWLTLDGDPYPAVIDGRVEWIVDGYTTTDAYPYSVATTLGDATSDSVTASGSSVAAQPRDDINYIRNSVKATVDAYDGTVTLYAWDESDPVLQTWSKAFPGIVQPKSDISPDLMAHLRYPADLFKVQREILSEYHVTDPNTFYSGTDFWSIPNDPAKSVPQPQPPYYLQVQMPGTSEPTFSLTTTFAPQRRPTLAAFMAINSEPGPNYGQIQILQLPSNTTIPGPAQQQNNFETDSVAKQQLTLLRGSGVSDIVYGNLLSLPVAGGVMYVEPVYIQAGGSAGYPLLRKVFVGFGQRVAFRDTLNEALGDVFGITTPTTPTTTPPNPNAGTAREQLAAAIAAAQAAYTAGQSALKAGDFAGYGVQQGKLSAALARAAAAEKALEAAVAPKAPTTPSASPTASPTSGA
ncbi:MAG: UPF0182 family protein [Candidatus Nanopelagicales bacterium]